jgi:4-amino-4-deoxy-L-arabinose transferase-like glycosyltransferase
MRVTSRCWPLAALSGLTALRLALAATFPLIPDEAYYWVWSRALAPGYPDHPPMVAIWIRIGTLLAGDTPLGIRLLGPLSVAIASVLLADAAERLTPGHRAGLRAAALLNATLLVGVGAVLMTPDAPLLAFWIACLWALARLIDSGDSRWWLAAGLFAGLAMASKYTAALLWAGVGLWLLVTPSPRAWLRRPAPWLGAALGLLTFAPVLLWEADHGWPSFLRQGSRVAHWDPSRAIQFLAELIGGQFGLVTPLAFVLCVAGVVEAVRQTWRTRDPRWSLLASLTVPSAALFTQHALGDRVQGNWPAMTYPAATIAAARLRTTAWQRLWWPAAGLGFGLTLLVYAQAALGLLPTRHDPIARQLAGWDTLAASVDAVRRQAGADYVAADEYGVAAELALLLPPDVTVVGIDPRWAQFRLPEASLAGKVGLMVRPAGSEANRFPTPWLKETPIGDAARRQGAAVIRTFSLIRITADRNDPGAVILPRPP